MIRKSRNDPHYIEQCFTGRITDLDLDPDPFLNGSGSAEKQILKFTSKY
jgi:hypothetical protein